MKISCPHCNNRAIITHRRDLSNKVAEIYAVCTSEECAARFLMRLSFQYNITPPASTLTNSLYEQFANLPPKERAEFIRTFAPPTQPNLF